MQKSFDGHAVMKDPSGQIVGIALGADFTAEHEMGHDPLMSLLRAGLPAFAPSSMRRNMMKDETGTPVLLGIDARRVLIEAELLEKHSAFLDGPAETRLVVKHMRNDDEKARWLKLDITPARGRADAELATAWDRGGFRIHAFSEEAREATRQLRAALFDRDVAVGLGSIDTNITGTGLRLPIISRLPAEVLETLLERDVDRIKLKTAARKTGIHKRLERAGCRYFALSPNWSDPRDDTAYPVKFFLNPLEQHKCASGYFRVEDLEDWTRGRGPVLKRPEAGLSGMEP